MKKRSITSRPGPAVIKLLSCSNQLSMEFQLLIKTNLLSSYRTLRFVFILLMNVKMPTIVGILTFMGQINFMLG